MVAVWDVYGVHDGVAGAAQSTDKRRAASNRVSGRGLRVTLPDYESSRTNVLKNNDNTHISEGDVKRGKGKRPKEQQEQQQQPL